MPPGRAWLHRAQSRHGDARRAGARPQTYPFVSYCLYLERCLETAPRHRACCARVPPSGPPSLQSPTHTGGKSRSRMQDGRRSDLTLTTRARRPICDASIPSQEELRLLVQPGTCTPILPNAQDNRAFVRLRTTI